MEVSHRSKKRQKKESKRSINQCRDRGKHETFKREKQDRRNLEYAFRANSANRRIRSYGSTQEKKVRSEEVRMESWAKSKWMAYRAHGRVMRDVPYTFPPLMYYGKTCIRMENPHDLIERVRAEQARLAWILAKEHSNRKTSSMTTILCREESDKWIYQIFNCIQKKNLLIVEIIFLDKNKCFDFSCQI